MWRNSQNKMKLWWPHSWSTADNLQQLVAYVYLSVSVTVWEVCFELYDLGMDVLIKCLSGLYVDMEDSDDTFFIWNSRV